MAHEVLERIGRSALSFALGLRIFGAWGAYMRVPVDLGLRDTGWSAGSRERDIRRTYARTRGARARARCVGRRARLDRPRRRGSGHRQEPARVRAREACPRRGVRGPPRALDRSRRHRTAVPTVPRGSASARGAWPVDGGTAGTQLQAFEETLALLTDRAASAPVLLVLEDLHWADSSTLDLLVFLAHNLDDRPLLLLATYRADEPRRPSAMRASPTASAAPARRSFSSSVRSSATS